MYVEGHRASTNLMIMRLVSSCSETPQNLLNRLGSVCLYSKSSTVRSTEEQREVGVITTSMRTIWAVSLSQVFDYLQPTHVTCMRYSFLFSGTGLSSLETCDVVSFNSLRTVS